LLQVQGPAIQQQRQVILLIFIMQLPGCDRMPASFTCLAAGVKGLDTLTPLGRGASLLVIGPNNSGKTTLALDAVQGCQLGSNMRCVLASTTLSAKDLEKRLKVRVSPAL
jgi:F0F1-type ATP synthase alpha subunit